MWLCDKWIDYELLDCSDGERLERWGKYILIRPDPQVIWKGGRKANNWNNPHGVYKRIGGGGSWTVNKMPESWCITYPSEAGKLTFRLKPMGFKHTGLFPEQATNWDFAQEEIMKALSEGHEKPKVLNLFAYTGGATVACSKAGASLVHVDASSGMTQAAKENMALSGLEDAPCRYIVDDCKKFVEREIRRGNKYDGIIMDPPSYGRGPKGEVWKLEDCADELVGLTVKLLSDDPVFVIINSYTTGLSPAVMQYMLIRSLPEKLKQKAVCEIGETCLLTTSNGLPLPSGATVRVKFRRSI